MRGRTNPSVRTGTFVLRTKVCRLCCASSAEICGWRNRLIAAPADDLGKGILLIVLLVVLSIP